MSIILSGLIHIFRPLLSSLSGALDCKGVGPWYFLLGLRIVAIFFSNGPWDTIKEDIACNWAEPMNEKSRDFCMALCHNEHFPISVAATWGLVFLVLLLLIGLMRLTSHRGKKKEDEKEKEDKEKGLAIVETVPHESSTDISTVYLVGRRGLPRRYGPHPHRPASHHHAGLADWYDWHGWHDGHGTHVAHMARPYHTDVGFVPSEAGGYGIPNPPGQMGQTPPPSHCLDMAQHKTSVCLVGRQAAVAAHSSGAEPYGAPPFQSPVNQTHVMPYCNEAEQYNAPTRGSPYKSKMAARCWPADKHHEPFHQRYTDPGAGESDHMRTMGTHTGHAAQGKMAPRYCEDGRYGMATKCKMVSESSRGHIALPPSADGQANMAVKRRPVQGRKMHPKCHVTFEAGCRADWGPGSNVCAQPWMPTDANCRPTDGKNVLTGPSMVPGPAFCCHGDTACACAETCDPGDSDAPLCEPQHRPCSCAGSNHDRYKETTAGPQEEAKMSISKICGVPLFDIWVALLLAMEICFLCAIFILQLPKLWGRSWLCLPGAPSCPQSVECTVKARAEKRVALWGLAFTSILFIIACSGYFNLRFCWNRKCRQMCGAEDRRGGEDACAEETSPEDCARREDVEGGNEGNNNHGL